MSAIQTGILAPLTPHSRFLYFIMEPETADVAHTLAHLSEFVDGEQTIVGLGQSLILALGKTLPGMTVFPALVGPGFEVPSTQYALWFWLRGDDRGELHLRSREIEHSLAMDFRLEEVLDGFVYADSRDLTGYIDGTENPQDDAALAAAMVQGVGEGLDGSSFVAVQQWQHDLEYFEHMSEEDQDNIIGRRKSDNEELADAPESAHVKRTAQESFSPEAFILRRSMPWAEGNEAGLNFIAFGRSFDAYEALLNRMVGHEDGIADGLFSFSRPISGGYYWCPPMKDDKLDLQALDI
ncbi:MAG: Dyp-type peroxidase [Gammaproteobacteria bacterium]|nr:Dyp-type peroxidase [Gammaproteobacteria bacterium]